MTRVTVRAISDDDSDLNVSDQVTSVVPETLFVWMKCRRVSGPHAAQQSQAFIRDNTAEVIGSLLSQIRASGFIQNEHIPIRDITIW